MTDLSLRAAAEDDCDFLYELHRATMRGCVAKTWGWDETWQQQRFRQHFDPVDRQIIIFRGHDVGVLSVAERETHVFLQVLEVLPQYQRRGIATVILQTVLHEAGCKGKAVTLQVLKVNPARKLYEGLGFVTTGETDTHFLMRAAPPGNA